LTVKTDVLAITPTATATKAFSAAGSSFSMLLSALQQHAIEMQALVKQLIAYHPTDQVLSATVHAGGSGGTNGVVTITGTTGTGVKFTANGTIAGGALTGALKIANPGSYTTQPTTLTAEPVTGGGLTGAQVSLTMTGDSINLTALNNILSELL
jgi:hypothetical protein